MQKWRRSLHPEFRKRNSLEAFHPKQKVEPLPLLFQRNSLCSFFILTEDIPLRDNEMDNHSKRRARLPFDRHAITNGEERKGKREMKTGMHQPGFRQDIRPVQTAFSAQNHFQNALISNAVQPNPTKSELRKNTPLGAPPLPLLAPVKFFPIKFTKQTHFGFSISASNKRDSQLSKPHINEKRTHLVAPACPP